MSFDGQPDKWIFCHGYCHWVSAPYISARFDSWLPALPDYPADVEPFMKMQNSTGGQSKIDGQTYKTC